MYKKILKNIHSNIKNRDKYLNNLFKNSDRKPHGIHDKIPHFIFSAESPMHPVKYNMSHEEALDFLKDKGYHAEEMKGKYNEPERSIIIHNPKKTHLKHLNNLAQDLGQDSSIISDGYNHEMHYLNGPKAGQHHKGKGTVQHEKEPEDFYSTLQDGTHFTHAFNFDDYHKDSDFIKDISGKMKKSEDRIVNGRYRLKKAESGPKHKLALAGPGTKLIHYSPHQGLEELHPDYHGVRKIGSEAKQGKPAHPMTFYYAEGVEPESIVTSGSKSKYVTELGDKKLYDIAKDPHGLRDVAKEKAQKEYDEWAESKGWVGKSPVRGEDVRNAYHKEIKDAGFHGVYNSSLDNTMGHTVGMFEPMKPISEHNLHPNDFKETSAKDQHERERNQEKAVEFGRSNAHHNPEFLHNLLSKFKE